MGYSAEFMAACRDELTVAETDLRCLDPPVVVAERASNICGFYVLRPLPGARFELDALFVDPDRFRQGVGRALVRNALEALSGAGGLSLIIQSDPNALAFYQAVGARRVGDRESGSVPGRMLPLLVATA